MVISLALVYLFLYLACCSTFGWSRQGDKWTKLPIMENWEGSGRRINGDSKRYIVLSDFHVFFYVLNCVDVLVALVFSDCPLLDVALYHLLACLFSQHLFLVWCFKLNLCCSGEAIPLEYNLEGLNAISFDKGCYVGQELVARTHHRGVIRKRLLSLMFLDGSGKGNLLFHLAFIASILCFTSWVSLVFVSEVEQKVAPGSEVINTASGKKIGSVTTAFGCRGLGVLRLDEAFKGSRSLSIQGQEDIKVEAMIPKWWPAEWFSGSQQHSAVA